MGGVPAVSRREEVMSDKRTSIWEYSCGRSRAEGRGGREGLHLHLQVRDELPHGDLLRDLLVQALAVQDHAFQDGQGPLQDGHVHHGLAHVPRNLEPERARWSGSPRGLKA